MGWGLMILIMTLYACLFIMVIMVVKGRYGRYGRYSTNRSLTIAIALQLRPSGPALSALPPHEPLSTDSEVKLVLLVDVMREVIVDWPVSSQSRCQCGLVTRATVPIGRNVDLYLL